MSSYFWYQITGGEDQWREALGEHRDKIIQEQKPAFVTVLDAYSSPEATWDRDEYAKMKYSGPLYFDWDAEDISQTIPQFQLFLRNLQEMGVVLESLRLYATGGRGFHLEIPQPVFIPKISKTGTTALPYIYKEMAFAMVVDTLDLRVYTGRRGRMWRTPGVERSNGKFKVPILVSEAFAMTPELYNELCSAPRPEPMRELPTLNTALAAMFQKGVERTEGGLKRRAKASQDEQLLAKFKGQFPPSVERVMRGENLVPGVGFQKVAMQLAITANALGKTADQLVEACDGLVKNHAGDSARYGSPRKRREELRRMWDYTHDNPCYSYSRGGIRSLLDVDTPTSDLDGVSESVGLGHVPDNDEGEDEADALPQELLDEAQAADGSLVEGLFMTRTGIYRRTAEGARKISNIGFSKPSLLMDSTDGLLLGMEVGVTSDGKSMGRRSLKMRDFTSRSALSAMCTAFGGVFSGSDTQAGVVQLMLSRSAKKGNRVIYTVHKEGLDVVQNPAIIDRIVKDVLWVATDEVVPPDNREGVTYKFTSQVATQGMFGSDIHHCAALAASPEAEEWLHHLLRVNSPAVVGSMLGWYASCFHKQFYQEAYGEFPLLHPNGLAGSGKTQTNSLFVRLFYNTARPLVYNCLNTTAFSLKAALAGSASIPLILDEYKPSEMRKDVLDRYQTQFRLQYNQQQGASGGMTRGSTENSFRDVTTYTFSTPTVFIAEAQEMQTAIVHRCLPVSFTEANKAGRGEHWAVAQAGVKFMPQLGKLLLLATLGSYDETGERVTGETVESRRAALDPLRAQIRAAAHRGVHDRQVHNLAVAVAGLDFVAQCVATRFGERFAEDFTMLRNSLLLGGTQGSDDEINSIAMNEPAKVLNDMALISRTEGPDSEFAIREAKEYIVRDGVLELLMRESYIKYYAWCKRKGIQPLYTSADTFTAAMQKFPATVDRLSFDSPLRDGNGKARVFRLNLEKLQAEGVELFKTRA